MHKETTERFDNIMQQGGLRPEYDGYPLGLKVKQADTILLSFPMGFTDNHSSPNLTANDLNYYALHTDGGGPAMTWAMFAVGYVALGPGYEDKAAANFNRSFANVHAPFGVWMETPTGGTPNFLTGAGGFLQGVFSSYPGLRMNDTAIAFKPQLPPGAAAVKLRGLAWRGNRLDIEYDAVNLVVTVLQHDDGSDDGDDGEGVTGSNEAGARGRGRSRQRIDFELAQVRYEVDQRAAASLLESEQPGGGGGTAHDEQLRLHHPLSLMPRTTLAKRSQRTGVVVLDSHSMAPRALVAAPLTLVDDVGGRHALGPGVAVKLPRQKFALVVSRV
jgi:hypothetical protein